MNFAAWLLIKPACEVEHTTSIDSGLLVEIRRSGSVKDFFNTTNKTPPAKWLCPVSRLALKKKAKTKL